VGCCLVVGGGVSFIDKLLTKPLRASRWLLAVVTTWVIVHLECAAGFTGFLLEY